ncbi:MAG: translesion error-prone DNA polymerase V autoproteolytic subunit [Gammaproteobacteria bacterium]|nr:translesion error-prone DNA polymerase V autoproteolytic subunit [Gammaproteobacteria bacterium]MCP4090228.1 translesion error-prone DNA polymerase V autoproteolytic subunit [Gammaproteobacteria bacterium]MCP4832656.1 translesion error-prone DNA polymerase V autoproteolytic subunit [Gammaproteobacteria bacterium]MCP4930100.1 translesion error-prone DNA polymerase V autoproteolytic subunit [Gammaproteobacteria bacterium]
MPITHIAKHKSQEPLELPGFITRVPAGFPSPADDYMDKHLDLNEHLIKHPSATFYCRVSGDSMQGAGIFDGDLLIIDRAVKPENGHVVLASVNGELTCKLLDVNNKCLLAANKNYLPMPIHEDAEFSVEGVVIYSIRDHHVRTR